MQVWNLLHAARWNTGRKKSRQKLPSGHQRTTLSGYIFATKARIDNRKNLLSSNMSSTCLHNMVNFGPLAVKIGLPIWGTPSNFNGFRVLAVLLNGTLLVGVSQTLRRWILNRGCHLYSAGRPSRWALAHILVLFYRQQKIAKTSWKSLVNVDMCLQWGNNFIDVSLKLQQYVKTTNNL